MSFWQKLKWTLKTERQKEKLLERAVELLRFDPATFALYAEAVQDGVSIGFDKGMIGARFDGLFSVDAQSGKGQVRLRPQDNARHVAEILSHELRHCWQHKRLGHAPRERDMAYRSHGVLSLVFNRIAEADAYAFQTRFLFVLREQEGLQQNREGAQGLDEILDRAAFKMAAAFQENLASISYRQKYDLPFAMNIFQIHLAGQGSKWFAPPANDNMPVSPALTDFRRILKEEGLRPLTKMDVADEANFIAEVTRHIDKGALGLVSTVMNDFNAAQRHAVRQNTYPVASPVAAKGKKTCCFGKN